MAIDTTGGVAPTPDSGAGQPITKFETAGDWSKLDDNTLLQELNLGGDKTATPAGKPAGDETQPVQDAAEDDAALEEGGDADDSGEQPDAGAEGAEAVEGQEAAPEGEGDGKEAVVPTADRPLQAEFQVFDAEGELEIPELTLKFKANGEERELPLDRVVKLAQQGYYNEELVQNVREWRETQPKYEQALQELEQERQMLLDGWRRVLSGDEEYLAQEQEAFLQAQSPEARAQRAEQEVQRIRQQQQMGQQEQAAQQFVASLVPEFEALEQAAPNVTFEEIVGRFNLLTAPLMVRGQIPPSRYNEVARIIQSELKPWAESRNTERATKQKAATEQVKQSTAKTAAMKRTVSRAVMPQGTHAPEAPKNKKYETAQDILDDIPNLVRGQTPSR